MNERLKDTYRQKIVEILSGNPRVERVLLFGSRAMGTHTVTSDVDLALFGEKLTLDDLAKLQEAIERLPMPQCVDFVLYHRIENENLMKHIQQRGVEWFRRSSTEEKTVAMDRE